MEIKNAEFGREGDYEITGIGKTSLNEFYIDHLTNLGQPDNVNPGNVIGPAVWFDIYGNRDYWHARGDDVPNTYGWVSADDAEQIALAILIAVKKARQEI